MRRVFTVAVNTLRQVVRIRLAVVFLVLLAVLLPVMGLNMTGDGTIKGRLQSFVSYGLALTSLLLLSVLTIIASVYSITSDIDQRQIFTVLTKPVRRWQLLAGKLLGMLILDTVLLSIFAATIYTIARMLPAHHNTGKAEMKLLRDEFFTARRSLVPKEPDVTDEVLDIFRRRHKMGEIPPEALASEKARQGYLNELADDVKLWKRAVEPGSEISWQFENVRPKGPPTSLFIRFKYDVSFNPPDLHIIGKWFAGDTRGYGPEIPTPLYRLERRDIIRTFHEIEVPPDCIAEDGFLTVGFYNDPRLNNAIVVFPPEDGLEVLYRAGSFEGNFIRAVLIIMCRLVFLACLGVFSASFLSLPVAVLLCMLVFGIGSISSFCLESFDFLGENAGRFYYYLARPVVEMVPRFDKFNPSEWIVPARIIEWTVVARVAVGMAGIKGFILLFFGIIIFGMREIARVVI